MLYFLKINCPTNIKILLYITLKTKVHNINYRIPFEMVDNYYRHVNGHGYRSIQVISGLLSIASTMITMDLEFEPLQNHLNSLACMMPRSTTRSCARSPGVWSVTSDE